METNKDKLIVKSCEIDEDAVRLSVLKFGMVESINVKTKVIGEVKVVGRVQSRTYEKKFEDGRIEQRVAYEVSIGSLEVINKDENSNQNEEAEAI